MCNRCTNIRLGMVAFIFSTKAKALRLSSFDLPRVDSFGYPFKCRNLDAELDNLSKVLPLSLLM